MVQKTSEKKASKATSKNAKAKDEKAKQEETVDDFQSTRETVESVVVAFILAFLFRAFVAEAFVIPTGSMAPTLMGAHKDLVCEHCGQQYQANASAEYDSNTGMLKPDTKTLASCCPNCRGRNIYDFENNKNHLTFPGDRILVSKFDYVLSHPKRWDVFVFKQPQKASVNYIKRLVGLPGETLRLIHGDVYLIESGNETIARKPPHKIQAMKQLVHDTQHIPAKLVKAGWPSSWQPLPEAGGGWKVELSESDWQASLTSTTKDNWIRYYHKFASDEQWAKLEAGESIGDVDPYQTRLITDYQAYNSEAITTSATSYFDLKEGWLKNGNVPKTFRTFVPNPSLVRKREFSSAKELYEKASGTLRVNDNYGSNWVGDLTCRFEVDLKSESGVLLLDLVEFGIHFRCAVDVSTGKATLQALDGIKPVAIFEGGDELTASTSVQGAGSYTFELANFDDRIVLWVNGSVVDFGNTDFTLDGIRSWEQRRPYWSPTDPKDAAPAGIGGREIEMSVSRASVHRDIYYTQRSNGFSDIGLNRSQLRAAIPDKEFASSVYDEDSLLIGVYSHPEWWDQVGIFAYRDQDVFRLEDDQYFPLGDNSAASLDARFWLGPKYVEEKFLLGKALLVFWPHTWNRPVPWLPNFQRMGLIR